MAKKLSKSKAENETQQQGANEQQPAAATATPQSKDYTYVIQNKKVRRDTRHRRIVAIVGIVLIIILLIIALFYACYASVEYNNFRVVVERSGSKILSLSNNFSMDPSTELIEIVGPDKMTNTTLAHGKNLMSYLAIEDRLAEIASTEGAITTKEDIFIAGTFYMQNVSSADAVYTERVHFDVATKGAEKALRVMLIRNDQITVYAAPTVNDQGETVPEQVVPIQSGYTRKSLAVDANGVYSVVDEGGEPWYAEPFYNDEYAVYNTGIPLKAGEKVKYSIVIWFEGWDPECIDEILDGAIVMTLSFDVEV